MTVEKVSVYVTKTITKYDVAVTSDYGGAGQQFSRSDVCERVDLRNASWDWEIQYRVGSEPWADLPPNSDCKVEMDLSATTLYFRRARIPTNQTDAIPIVVTVHLPADDTLRHEEGATVDIGTEGGGATAFTELTDVPDVITPGAPLIGNLDGTALANSATISTDDEAATVTINPPNPDPDGYGCALYILGLPGGYGESSNHYMAFTVEDGKSKLVFKQGPAASFDIMVLPDETVFTVGQDSPLTLEGLDVSATDTNARLVVDEVSYGVAKAIKVKVGADTYYWPLFGGEDAGPTPAPSVALTDLTDCPETLVETQEVLVAGVGTMTFTHGLLTGFTPV